MNNEAIAVKCSLHGPQIVQQRQSSSYTLRWWSILAHFTVIQFLSLTFVIQNPHIFVTQFLSLTFVIHNRHIFVAHLFL